MVGAFAAQGPRLGRDALVAAQAQDWARAAVDAIGLACWSLVPIGHAVFSASLVRLAWRGGRAVLGQIAG